MLACQILRALGHDNRLRARKVTSLIEAMKKKVHKQDYGHSFQDAERNFHLEHFSA